MSNPFNYKTCIWIVTFMSIIILPLKPYMIDATLIKTEKHRGWVWRLNHLQKVALLKVSLVQLFVKVHNEKVEFQKAECLVKAVKKCFLKKLSVWLTLIKVTVWGINYQKGQCIYKRVYFILCFFFFFFFLDVSLFHTY